MVTRLHCWVEGYLLYHHLSLSLSLPLWQKETMPIALLRIVLGLLLLVSTGTKSGNFSIAHSSFISFCFIRDWLNHENLYSWSLVLYA